MQDWFTLDTSYTWKSSSIKIVCLGISRTNFFVFYVRWGSSNKEYLLQLLQLVKYCSCQWICQQLSEFFFSESRKDLNPNSWSSSTRTKWTDSNTWRLGGKQSNADTSGLRRKGSCPKKKKSKEEQLKSRTQQIIKLPQKKQHMFFSKQSFWSINPS